MSEARHTPGPWYAEVGDPKVPGMTPGYDVWHHTGIGQIARVRPGLEPDPTAEANARLIAAAPDLLAACKVLMGVFEDAGLTDTREYDQARRAVARATGDGEGEG